MLQIFTSFIAFRGNYIALTTYARVQELWKKSHKSQKTILKQRNVRDFVEKYLQYDYLPAIISHLLEERFFEKVSHETLYIYIYSSPKVLKKYLLRRMQGRKSKKNNRFTYIGTGKNIPNRIDISLRDKLANERKEFGHFEADSVESCRTRGRNKSCLTVMVDRAIRLTIIRKTASLTSIQTAKSMLKATKPYRNTIKSITNNKVLLQNHALAVIKFIDMEHIQLKDSNNPYEPIYITYEELLKIYQLEQVRIPDPVKWEIEK